MTGIERRSPRGSYAKTAERRRDIVDAAVRVFAAKGYHGGSLREISRELGMSLTAVTHHFGGKEQLLQAVLDETDRQGNAFDTSAGLVEWSLRLVESNLDRPELLRMFAIVAAEASAPDHPAHAWFVARFRGLARTIAAIVVADQQLGRIDPQRDPEQVANTVIALWDGVQLQWLIDPGVDMTGRMRTALTALLPESVTASGAAKQ